MAAGQLKHYMTYLRTNGIAYTSHRAMQKITERVLKRYDRWARKRMPSLQELERQRKRTFCPAPFLSIVVPVYNTKPRFLMELAESFVNQTYHNWEACLYDGRSTNPDTIACLRSLEKLDHRIHVALGEENQGISGNTNLAIQMVKGDYIILCDHDDILTSDALYWIADAIEQKGADLVYSDEDKINEASNRYFDPHFKPDFSLDMLRSSNYICHLLVVKRTLLDKAGLLDSRYDGSQDHDLALRASEHAACIVHVPRVLYHWRQLSTSMSHQKLEKCQQAAKRAVEAQLRRQQVKGQVSLLEGRSQIKYMLSGTPLVTVILEHHGSSRRLHKCIEALERAEKYPAVEWLIVSPVPMEAADADMKFRAIPWEAGASRFHMLDKAIQLANGEYIVCMDSGVQVETEDWLSDILAHCMQPGVGIVCPILYGKDKKIRHAGYAVGVKNVAAGRQEGLPRSAWGYFGHEHYAHNISAASAAFFMVGKEIYLSHSGFDAAYQTDLGDVDFCLKLLQSGLRHVLTPLVKAVYEPRESGRDAVLRGAPEAGDRQRFVNAWGENVLDPYYNENFTREDASFTLRKD